MKHYYHTAIFILLASPMIFLSNTLSAQQQPTNTNPADKPHNAITPTVEIVTDYKGKITETDKIDMPFNKNDIPAGQELTFTYPDLPYQTTSHFHLTPIPVATMLINEEQQTTKYGYVKAGIAYPLSPDVNLYLHASPTQKSNANFYFRHHSFWGKLPRYKQAPITTQTIPDNIAGDNTNTTAGIALQHRWEKITADINATYKHQSLLYHGQDTLLLKNTNYTEQMADKKYLREHLSQSFNIFKSEIALHSPYDAGKKLYFDGKIHYDALSETKARLNNNATKETLFGIDAALACKVTTSQQAGIRLHTAYRKNNLPNKAAGIYAVEPFYKYQNGKINISAGLHIESVQENNYTTYNLYPAISLAYALIPQFATPYLHISGGSDLNNYEKIITENPYILPGLNVATTRTGIKTELGLKGSFIPYLAYRLNTSYATVNRMYFFINSTTPLLHDGINSNILRSNFDIRYDDITRFDIRVELEGKIQDLETLLFAQYTKYNMKQEKKPWHRPACETGLQMRYKWDSLLFTLNAAVRSKAPVLLPDIYQTQTTTTGSSANLTLTAEYRLNNKLALYIQGTNLLNQNYRQYYLYYNPGITIGGGITYSF